MHTLLFDRPAAVGSSLRKTLKTMLLLFVGLCAATQMMAQDAGNAQREAMRNLQTRMDELRAQMVEIQSELDAMHGAANLSQAVKNLRPVPEPLQTGAIERTLPPLPPAVPLSSEQQRAAMGKETMDYETFSEEPEAAPRLYNAPLEPTYPGFFVLGAPRPCCVSMGR